VDSVADSLRTRTREQVLQLPVAARIALALSLGDQDLDLFSRSSGLDQAEALRRLRNQRAQGRTPSRSASW
jgi:hypothetical protein